MNSSELKPTIRNEDPTLEALMERLRRLDTEIDRVKRAIREHLIKNLGKL